MPSLLEIWKKWWGFPEKHSRVATRNPLKIMKSFHSVQRGQLFLWSILMLQALQTSTQLSRVMQSCWGRNNTCIPLSRACCSTFRPVQLVVLQEQGSPYSATCTSMGCAELLLVGITALGVWSGRSIRNLSMDGTCFLQCWCLGVDGLQKTQDCNTKLMKLLLSSSVPA